MPVLEASACGTPVICTKGGATDDFVNSDFAYLIESRVTPVKVDGAVGSCLEPDIDHLIELMFRVMDDDAWRQKASHAGAANAANFTWDIIAEKLLDAIFVLP